MVALIHVFVLSGKSLVVLFFVFGSLSVICFLPTIVFYNSEFRKSVGLGSVKYATLVICSIPFLLIHCLSFYFIYVNEFLKMSRIPVPELIMVIFDNGGARLLLVLHLLLFVPILMLFCYFCSFLLSLVKK